MKILTPRIKKIARITLWSIAVILLLFLIFTFGGSLILNQIEYECMTNSMFQIDDTIFECEVIPKGVLL